MALSPLLHGVRAAVLLLGCLFSLYGSAQTGPKTILGYGSALIRNGDIPLARWQASADAMKNAVESQGSRVQTGTLVSNGNVFETLSVKTDVRTRDVQVLEERREGNQLYITLQATLETAGPPAACPPSPYRKRVLFTPMPLLHPEHLRRGESTNFPVTLARLLAAAPGLEEVAPLMDSNGSPLQVGGDGPRLNPEALSRLLDGHQAQVVVAGVVRSFVPVADGLFPGLTGAERGLALEVMLFGPLGEAPLAARRFAFRLPAAHLSGPLADPNSAAFAASRFGQSLNRSLAEVAKWVQDQLACAPFTARVQRVEGNRLGIAAGSQSGLREGDGLILFRPGQGAGLAFPLASATVRGVESDRASAELGVSGGPVAVQIGDVLVSH